MHPSHWQECALQLQLQRLRRRQNLPLRGHHHPGSCAGGGREPGRAQVVDENEADMAQLERATAMLERCLCMPDAFPLHARRLPQRRQRANALSRACRVVRRQVEALKEQQELLLPETDRLRDDVEALEDQVNPPRVCTVRVSRE